jgi:lysozyme family protein
MISEALVHSILDDIERSEGWPKYTNRPSDRGGPTKGGITLTTLSTWRGRPCTIADLQALERPEARAIYTHIYLTPWYWLPDDRLMHLCIDFHVNSGPSPPATALQLFANVTPDGRVGPVTRGAILAVAPERYPAMYQAVWTYRHAWFMRLAFDAEVREFLRTHPKTQLHNLQGWMNRLLRFL